jgi:hypothetical protein
LDHSGWKFSANVGKILREAKPADHPVERPTNGCS